MARNSVVGMPRQELERLQASAFVDAPLTQDEFVHIGGVYDAVWLYPGQPGDHPYHALLTSGLHSDGFINCRAILANTNLCQILAQQVIQEARLREQERIDWIVGPGNAAITLSYEIARQLGAKHGFSEKDEHGKPTKFSFVIPQGSHVLIVNELMTTGGGSTFQAKQAVGFHNPNPVEFLPFSVVMVKRSVDKFLSDNTPVRWHFEFDIANWKPENCPYCKAGSQAIKPKVTVENWTKLTGRVA